MLEILITILFCWLFFKALALCFRVAWGTAKILAFVLFAVALPMLVLGVLFVGGLALILPLILVGIAFALLKSVV